MGHGDARTTLHLHHPATLAAADGVLHAADGETPAHGPAASGPAAYAAGSWEHAWIDLGGEG